MKLPLASTVVGVLLGICAVMLVEPQTTEGAAFIMLFMVLVVTAVGLAAGKLRALGTGKEASRRGPNSPQG